MENATSSYYSMKRTNDKKKESITKGSITSVYEYVPVTAIDREDALQRFGYIKVEATLRDRSPFCLYNYLLQPFGQTYRFVVE